MMFSGLLALVSLLSLSSAYSKLSDDTLKSLPGPGNDFDIKDGALLAPILRPRVSGTVGNTEVLNHFIRFFKQNLPAWDLELHNSTSTTPTSDGKEIPFVNLIATRLPPGADPGEVGRLTLVAHYDSKLTPEGFIGATDSAAPCAMLLHVARSVDAALTKKWANVDADGLDDDLDEKKGVQILFLDGEEAFHVWTHEDSLYGARALAADWEFEYRPAGSTYRTPLDSISLFVLLDLLGAASPRVPSYFKTTHWAYRDMANIEKRLRSLGLFKSSPNHSSKKKRKDGKPRREPAFLPDGGKDSHSSLGGMIEDDHIPFMQRGVEILHMIPSPFPRVWHEIEDDGEHLDMDTVEDWTKLVTAFVGEWMDLEGFFDVKPRERAEFKGKTEL